jgi:hypothetical protein
MNESRLQVFRAAVDALTESLEAVIRLSRWTPLEAKPEPLVAAAGKLLERLGTASRLSASRFHGTANEVAKVDAIRAVLQQLDAAYLSYRQDMDGSRDPQHDVDAVAALETDVARAMSTASAWR